MSTVTKTSLRIQVTDDVLQKLDAVAKKQNVTPEALIERLLLQHESTLESTKPIVLNDTARQHLEKVLGKNFTTADELVSYVQRMLTLNVGDVPIPLTPFLIDRLQTRAISMPFDKFVQMTVKRLLEEYVGVR